MKLFQQVLFDFVMAVWLSSKAHVDARVRGLNQGIVHICRPHSLWTAALGTGHSALIWPIPIARNAIALHLKTRHGSQLPVCPQSRLVEVVARFPLCVESFSSISFAVSSTSPSTDRSPIGCHGISNEYQ